MFDTLLHDPFSDAMRAIRERLTAPRREEARGIIGTARCANCGTDGLLYVKTPVGESVVIEPSENGSIAFDARGNAQYVKKGGTHVEHLSVCPARGARA